jgi:ribosome-associated protein
MATTELMEDTPATVTDARRQRSRKEACLCARIAEEFRGQNTVVLDLTEVTPVFDFFVITSGTNPRQMRALAEECRKVLKQLGHASSGIEGEGDNSWLLQDFGDIVIHVFLPEARLMYDLERLWADAKVVDWKHELGVTPAAPLAEPAGHRG